MITIKTPGKLMLAGDWSVLESGNHCIVMPIDKYVTVTLEKTEAQISTICAPDIYHETIQISWHNSQLHIITKLSEEQKKLFLTVQKALEIVLSYIQEQNLEHSENIEIDNTENRENFALTISSEISTLTLPDGTITKPGLGSSAAITVAVITALLDLHDFDVTSVIAKNIIFKLAYLAHIQSQGNMGSGFDIAACTFEKVITYQRLDPIWLVKKIQTTESLTELVNTKWPQLVIAPIIIPDNMRVIVGFVGTSAKTTNLLSLVQTFKKRDPEKYREIIHNLETIVKNLIEQLTQHNNHTTIIKLISEHRDFLKKLSELCDNQLETPELTKLITIAQEHHAGAKFSGAGGGDCGIAICFDEITAQKIKISWTENGITPLDISIKK